MTISSILRLITLALELWVMRESRREEINLQEDEKALETLRNRPDSASQLAADKLRKRILRGVGIVGRVDTLSTPSAPLTGGTPGAVG